MGSDPRELIRGRGNVYRDRGHDDADVKQSAAQRCHGCCSSDGVHTRTCRLP